MLTWTDLAASLLHISKPTALKHIFHTTRLAVSDFRFFITQLQAYCHSEVIDCSWRVLEEFIVKKARSDERGVERKGEEAGIGNAANDDGGCDLDSLIEQHRIYLDRLVSKTLLINGGKRGKGEVNSFFSLPSSLSSFFPLCRPFAPSLAGRRDDIILTCGPSSRSHQQLLLKVREIFAIALRYREVVVRTFFSTAYPTGIYTHALHCICLPRS